MSEESGRRKSLSKKEESKKEDTKLPLAGSVSSTSSTTEDAVSPRSSSSRTRLGSIKDKESSSSPSKTDKDKSSPRHKDKESRNKHAISRTAQRQNSIMPIPMPAADKVEELFKKLLTDLPPMPTKQKEELMKMNPASKWSFIQANNPETLAKLKDDKGEISESPTFFIKKLSSQPTNDLVKDLRVQLSTQPVAWYKKFRDHKGIDVLLELLSKIDNKYRNKPEGFRLQNEVLRTLKVCFHSKVNVEDFASEGTRLRKIILSIDAGDENVRQLTYELLGLIALFADDGPSHLLPAFDFLAYTRSEKRRFKILIDALKLEASHDIVANALVLVNAIINTQDDLDERIALRLEMLSLGLDTTLADLKTKHNVSKGSSGAPSGVHKDILAQIETFEGDVEQDEEEYQDRVKTMVAGKKVNFRDPKELFMGLMSHIKDKDHLYGAFYSIMKHLLEMPTDNNKGVKLWWLIAKFVQQLTTGKDQLNVEADRLVDIVELLAATSDKVALEQLREESFVKIETLEAETANLKVQLKSAQDKVLTAGASSEAVKLLEVAKLKVERTLDDKKRDFDELKKQYSNETKEFEIQKAQLTLQISELTQKNSTLNQQFTDLKDKLKDTRRTLERTNSFNITADKEDLVRNVVELQKDNSELHKKVDELKKELESSKNSNKSTKEEGSVDEDLVSEINKLKKKLQDAEARQLEAAEKATAQTEKEKSILSKLEEVEKLNEALKQDNNSLKDLIATAKAPVTVTQSVAIEAKEELVVPAAPAPPMGGPPPPPGPGGPPPPPGPGGPPPPSVKKAPAGPKPKVPMKNLQWSKLAAAQANKSLFKDMDISKVELDLAALETQFGAKAVDMKSQSKVIETKKEQLVSFVQDPKRLTNIGIFIQSFKNTYREVAESILMVNESVITAEMAAKLMDNAPLAEELTQVSDFVKNGGGVDKLNNVDKFFYQLSFVPQLVPRLQSIAFKLNFESKLNELKVAALRVKKANRDLEKSQAVVFKLFEVILAVGNFMNNGTARGNATGFQLSSLNQLVATKTTDNKSTLLDYLVNFFQSKKSFADIMKLPQDLENLQLATKVNWSVLLGDVQDLRKGLVDTKSIASSVTKSAHELDVFVQTVLPAFETFELSLTALELQVQEIDESYKQICILYGSSPQSVPPEEFYGNLHTFFAAFDKTVKQNALNQEKDARRLKLEASKKALEEKKAALAKEAAAKKTATSPIASIVNVKDTKDVEEDDSLESIVSSARSGSTNRFRKNLLRRQETLREKRAQELKSK